MTKLDKSFVEFILEQIQDAGYISHKYMFGGCAVYCDDKVVALICDNQLYIKPTMSGRKFIKNPREFPPYPSAKNYFLIEDEIENREWLCELVRITAEELKK
jgi:TfoX/Sxy family transcriptional regulator of competence genes